MRSHLNPRRRLARWDKDSIERHKPIVFKALFRWATKKGYLTRNPAADSEILKRRKHAQRHRRLDVGEEGNLLEHAGQHLQPCAVRASREALRAADLTFHGTLRHEAGSRLLEAGWPFHNVAHMLGHANISQTSTYLNATKVGLQESMRRLDASRCKPVARNDEIEQAPLRNGNEGNTPQPLVN